MPSAHSSPRRVRRSRRAVSSLLQFSLLEPVEPRVLFAGAAPTALKEFGFQEVGKVGVPMLITYETIKAKSGAIDPENDPLVFLITRVDPSKGYLYIKRAGTNIVSLVPPNAIHMGAGDVLAFVPTVGDVTTPLSVRAADDTTYAANDTAAYVKVTDTPTVRLTTTEVEAWEGNTAHPGRIRLTRTGDLSQALTVKIIPLDNNPNETAGGAERGKNYRITVGGADAGVPHKETMVTIPANESSVEFTVTALEDNRVAGALQQAGVALVADFAATPAYLTDGAAWIAGVNIVDSAPKVTIAPAAATIPEGVPNQVAFTLTRTGAPGRPLSGVETFVNLSYTGSTFYVGAHLAAPPVAYFAPGETTKTIVVTTNNDGVNSTSQTLVAAISGSGFAVVGNAAATVALSDASPVVSIAAAAPTLVEGVANQAAFTLTRTIPPGGSVNVPTYVNLSYTGTASTFGAGSLVAPPVAYFAPGQTTVTVVVTPNDNGIATGNQTLAATISGTGFNTTGNRTATVTVADAASVVTIAATLATADEATRTPGQVRVTRTGSTAGALDVAFTVGTAATNAVRNTSYYLSYTNGSRIDGNVVTIPAGAAFVDMNVVPIDDFSNAARTVPITLVANGTRYNLPTGGATASGLTATVTITTVARAPSISSNVFRITQRNRPIELSFNDLVSLTGARLAEGTAGTLQLRVGTVALGTLQVRTAGSAAPTAAGANTVLSAGQSLIWTPPLDTSGSNLSAFTLNALEGSVASPTAATVFITVS